MDNKFTHYVGIKFTHSSRSYFFGTNDSTFKINDPVVVDTIYGRELGLVSILPQSIETYSSTLDLAPIQRRATDKDVYFYQENLKDSKDAANIFIEEQNKLNLNMHLIYADYTLDKAKITFTYASDERVDFRELLKVLAARLRTRIELRQIGPRDKAKLIGGIGICGLPLCCSTFLNEFDGISINRAKNQMLAINIPKLSGQCGKLVCCLKYEDDTYTDLKKMYPEIGEEIIYNKQLYKVISYNVISKQITFANEENDSLILSLDDFNNLKHKKGMSKKGDDKKK